MSFKLWDRHRTTARRYRRRQPERSELYGIVYNLADELELVWESRYRSIYGCFRDEVKDSFSKYLDCGVLAHGCARLNCINCNHSELLAFSCKRRGVCPSCTAKRGVLFAESLESDVLLGVPNRHVVFTVPKRIRAYFKYDRNLNQVLFSAAWESIKELYGEVVPDATPAAVMSVETAGEMLNFHPHLHSIVADGVVTSEGEFIELSLSADKLNKLFAHKVLSKLKARGLITDTVIAQMGSWQASGFSVWIGDVIEPQDSAARLFISQYLTKCPVRLKDTKIIKTASGDKVRYGKDNNFRDYAPLDFLAAISAQIPNRWEQTIRYFGAYSARTRGKRRKQARENEVIPTEHEIDRRAVSKSWAKLIKKVYEVNPLLCPKCGGEMRIKAFITDTMEVARIIKHLNIPPYRAPPKINLSNQLEIAA